MFDFDELMRKYYKEETVNSIDELSIKIIDKYKTKTHIF